MTETRKNRSKGVKDVADVLTASNFESPGAQAPEFSSSSPADILITLTIDEIEPLPFNPRRTPNPKYQELKTSILNRGYEGALVVTRKPGEQVYWAHGGQNTRVKILKELWEETKDQRFYKLNCQIKPYIDDFHEVAACRAENKTQGEMTFWDEVIGLRDMFEKLEQRLGKKPTYREFTEISKAEGTNVPNISEITRYNYAIDFLNLYIPEFIQGPQSGVMFVRDLKTINTIFTEIMKENIPAEDFNENKADAQFGRLLAKFDGPKMDINQVEKQAILKLTKITGKDQSKIAMEFAGRRADKKRSKNKETLIDDDEVSMKPATKAADTSKSQEKATAAKTTPASDGSKTDIRLLRKSVRDAAAALAELFGMSDLIVSIGDGMGFVIDLPAAPLSDFIGSNDEYRVLYGLPKDTSKVWCWWLCASVSEQLSVNRKLSQTLPPDTRLSALLEKADTSQFFPKLQQHVGHADIRELSELWLTQLDADQFDRYVQLIDTARTLRSVANNSRVEIWGNKRSTR